MDFVYTTCEAGKRSVNHARSLASPGRAEAVGVGVGVGVGESRCGRPDGALRCGAVRCACAAGRDVQVRCDVMC